MEINVLGCYEFWSFVWCQYSMGHCWETHWCPSMKGESQTLRWDEVTRCDNKRVGFLKRSTSQSFSAKEKYDKARQLGISILSSGSNLDSNSLSFKGCGCRRPHSISFASQRSAGKCLHAATRLWLVWSRDQTTSSWSHPHCLYTGILVALLGNRY